MAIVEKGNPAKKWWSASEELDAYYTINCVGGWFDINRFILTPIAYYNKEDIIQALPIQLCYRQIR